MLCACECSACKPQLLFMMQLLRILVFSCLFVIKACDDAIEVHDEIQAELDRRIMEIPPGATADAINSSRGFLEDLKVTLKPCLHNFGYTDPDLGIVALDPILYCDPRTFRFLKGLSCCAPQPPSDNFPLFHLFTPATDLHSNGTQINWRNASEAGKLGEGPIVYLIHGWSENVNTSVWLRKAVEAWTKTRNRNVIVVDWTGDEGNKYYFQTAVNVRTVGKAVGFSILNWGLVDRVSVVGMSCGAQAVGEAGAFVKERGRLIADCVGLDPAGPCFDGGSEKIRLTADDCRLVQIVHSSAESSPTSIGIFDRKFGTYYKSGQCDFWVNCGKDQGDGCADPKFNAVVGPDGAIMTSAKQNDFCAHHRAPLVYVSQVNQSCNLMGEVCVDCQKTSDKPDECASSRAWGERAMAPDSRCQVYENSDFNVKTTSYYPYCD